ncbi:dipeptidase PepV [Cohnella cholangitidis]|uniref:dipeptidase PepV n=1 Tax=Cohnella cholangitidis TaxID=2598458 RepID=UPI001E37A525|nr:dipeptidase PepV [Cohnella cholangitidis]
MDWRQEAEKRKDRLLADLYGLLKFESVKDTDTRAPGMPMGQGIAEALNYMLALSREAGFHVSNLEGYAGYAEYAPLSSQDYIAVLCHLDVVPASGEWTSPPFEPEIREGKLFARGAIDDKGPAMAAFYALKIVKELGLQTKHNVRLIFGTDEEHTSTCMDKYREREKPPLCGFTPDGEFPIVHAEKGQINVKVVLQDMDGADDFASGEGAGIRLIAFHAGHVANMVPDQATATLSGETERLLAISASFGHYCAGNGLEGGTSWATEGRMEFSVKGISAHGMEPHKGVNAGLALVHFLRPIYLQREAGRFLACVDDVLYADCLGGGFSIAMQDRITGALTVNAGILRYSPGRESFFHLNLRYPACGDEAWILERIAVKAEAYGLKLDTPILKKPHYVPDSYPMIRLLQDVYREETSMEPSLLSTGGGTYGAHIPNGVCFGPLFPGTPSTAHQQDECIDIEDLLRATAIYARAIYEVANADLPIQEAGV